MSSSFNFCEIDYLHHSYIVEYYNTISSLPIVLLGVYGLFFNKKLSNKYDVRYVLLILIGLGSIFFHTTMTRVGQLFDEIPMIWLNSFLLYDMIPSFFWFISAFSITYYYIIFQSYEIFLIYFIFTGIFVYFTPIYMNKNIIASRLLKLSLSLFTIGFIKWILDNLCCNYLHDYYLHAWWHIWSGFSVYFYIQFQMALKPHYIYKYFPLLVVKVIKN